MCTKTALWDSSKMAVVGRNLLFEKWTINEGSSISGVARKELFLRTPRKNHKNCA